MNENDHSVRMVPAICTQCGGQLEVDPTQEAAVCKYCQTPFIVDKAIQNYNISHAHIDHVDQVKLDVGDSVKSVLSFAGEQLHESREMRKEMRREEREHQREVEKTFFSLFAKAFLIMIIFSLLLFVLQGIFGIEFFGGDDEETTTEETTDTSWYDEAFDFDNFIA